MPATSLNTISVDVNASQPLRWHSMEDASRSKTQNSTRRNIDVNIYLNANNTNNNNNVNVNNNSNSLLGQYSYAVNYDVWATHQVGIPLSELANTARGQRQRQLNNDPRNNQQSLIIPADSDVKADDLLACDFSELFRDKNILFAQSNIDETPKGSGNTEAEEENQINNSLSNYTDNYNNYDNGEPSNRDVETVIVEIENTYQSRCDDSDNRQGCISEGDNAAVGSNCDLSDRNYDTQ